MIPVILFGRSGWLRNKIEKMRCCVACVRCRVKKSELTEESGGLVNGFINSPHFEMHYAGQSFLRPGTKLNIRLNEDLTSKGWSPPVDRNDDNSV